MARMLGGLTSIRANVSPLKSRRAMLDTLLKQLNMVRLSVGTLALLALVGCNGLIQGPSDPGVSPEEKVAQDKWVNLGLPAFQNGTCTTCHNGSQPDIGFLAGAGALDIRQTLLNFNPDVVDLSAVQSSRVLTKGAHAGPALDAVAASAILEWLQAEQAAAGTTGGGTTLTLTTQPFAPLLCTSGVAGDPTCPINHVSLVDAGMGASPPVDLTGAEISFLVQPLSADMYVTDLTLKAGTAGVYLEHPLFVYIPPQGVNCSDGSPAPCPDTIDRFFSVKMDQMAATSGSIAGGTAAFTGFAPVAAAQLQISFKVLDVYRPMSGGTGGTTGGCKVLTGSNSFQSLVVPVMNVTLGGEGNKCSGCHLQNQNANAVSAMDITGINQTDTSPGGPLATACAQVLSRINMQDIPNSGVILAPEAGQDAAHPFKFANQTTNFTNFKNALTTWANAEKTAP